MEEEEETTISSASPSKDNLSTAREKLKSKLTKSKTTVLVQETPVNVSPEDDDEHYKRLRSAMAGPKKSVNAKDMQAVLVNEDEYDA